jgi:hypothetical protein
MIGQCRRLKGTIIASGTVTLIFILTLAGCASIRLISEYDRETDIAVTAFQKKMERFLISLERNIGKEGAEYKNNVGFYDGIKVDLSAIRVRAAAIPKNEITTQQIDLLIENVNNLERIHKLGMTHEDIPPLRTAFNESCTAILKLELAKKRGRH